MKTRYINFLIAVIFNTAVFSAQAGSLSISKAKGFDATIYNNVPEVYQQKPLKSEAGKLYEQVCAKYPLAGVHFFIKCGENGVGLTNFHKHGAVKTNEVVLECLGTHPESGVPALVTEPANKEKLQNVRYSPSSWMLVAGQNELFQFEQSEDPSVLAVESNVEMQSIVSELVGYIKEFGYAGSLAPMLMKRSNLPVNNDQVYLEKSFDKEGDGDSFRNVLTVVEKSDPQLTAATVTRIVFDSDDSGKPVPYGFCLGGGHSGKNKP